MQRHGFIRCQALLEPRKADNQIQTLPCVGDRQTAVHVCSFKSVSLTQCDGRQALVRKGSVAEVPCELNLAWVQRERWQLIWGTTSAGDPVVILSVRHTRG